MTAPVQSVAPNPVRSRRPPAAVMRAVNPVVRAVLRSSLGRRAGRLTTLQFDGKRSGRHFVIPVMPVAVDGRECVFTDASWAANFAGGRQCRLTRAGREQHGRGVLVVAPEEVGRALHTALAQLGHPRQLGLAVDRGHVPTVAELGAAGRVMIRVEVDPSAVDPSPT